MSLVLTELPQQGSSLCVQLCVSPLRSQLACRPCPQGYIFVKVSRWLDPGTQSCWQQTVSHTLLAAPTCSACCATSSSLGSFARVSASASASASSAGWASAASPWSLTGPAANHRGWWSIWCRTVAALGSWLAAGRSTLCPLLGFSSAAACRCISGFVSDLAGTSS